MIADSGQEEPHQLDTHSPVRVVADAAARVQHVRRRHPVPPAEVSIPGRGIRNGVGCTEFG